MKRKGRSAGAIIGFFAIAAAITTTILVLGTNDRASAAELEQFRSCDELQAWTTELIAAEPNVGRDADFAEDDAAAAPVAADGGGDAGSASRTAETAATGDTGDTGGTNTVVAGVDEIDIIDRIGDDRLVVARNGGLSLVDLTSRAILDEIVGVPWDARVSVDETLIWVAGSSSDGSGTEVRRIRVDGDAFVADGEWSTPGYLLDARRTGDRLHVVAVDYPQFDAIPFEGGPVPCDEVWRPVADPTTSAATLVASLPATGDLVPVAAAEVTGAAGNLLVTDSSVYIATETWTADPSGGDVTSGVHRFDLETLTPSGSGAVPGTLAGPFSLDEHDGYLRVATSLASFRAIAVDVGRPAADIDVATDVAAEPEAQGPQSLAEVFVLDTDGDLDIVGRTGLFGHDGETIHGVRFLGAVAYVVTFLNTDPFWVVDLADPAAPAVVGELEIPGFSAYLHPAGDGRVVGFGPDGSGSIAARLFDVSDPSAPALLDEQRLGGDSPIAWDYHSYVALDDGRFAVPVTDWPEYVGERCSTEPVPLPEPLPTPIDPGKGDGSVSGGGDAGSTGAVPPDERGQVCEPILRGGATGAAVIGIDGDRLTSPQRATVDSDGSFYAERIVLDPDGTWLLVGWDRIVPTDGGDPIALPADPSTGRVIID